MIGHISFGSSSANIADRPGKIKALIGGERCGEADCVDPKVCRCQCDRHDEDIIAFVAFGDLATRRGEGVRLEQ